MKLLVICPNWAGLASPIVAEMKRQGHTVTHLDHNDFSDFSYYDATHRTLSKLYFLIKKKNYKHLTIDNQISRTINSFFIDRPHFDAVIMTEPNIFNEHHLAVFKKHSSKLVATLWDSLRKSPANGKCLNLFDHVLSYDSEDCKTLNLTKINNYIDPSWRSSIPYNKCEYDVFSIMSYTKERYQRTVDFLDKNPTLKSNIFFYIDHPRKQKYIKDSRIKITRKLVLGDELKKEIDNSRAILDILQGPQSGLSFRVYESISYQRKLITTNHHVEEYDLFNKNNICVLRDNWEINRDFFTTVYQAIPDDIYQKYTLSEWVNKVITEISK